MNPRMRSRMPASIGSNQACPANSPVPSATVVLSCAMAWSPPARQRRTGSLQRTGDYATTRFHHPRDGTHYGSAARSDECPATGPASCPTPVLHSACTVCASVFMFRTECAQPKGCDMEENTNRPESPTDPDVGKADRGDAPTAPTSGEEEGDEPNTAD